MEKLSFKKIEQSKEFQEGLKEFREGKVPKDEPVRYNWYSKSVPAKQWRDYYSKFGASYTFLAEDKKRKEVRIGFLSVNPPEGCLPITNKEELMMIDAHRRASNHMPFVTK